VEEDGLEMDMAPWSACNVGDMGCGGMEEGTAEAASDCACDWKRLKDMENSGPSWLITSPSEKRRSYSSGIAWPALMVRRCRDRGSQAGDPIDEDEEDMTGDEGAESCLPSQDSARARGMSVGWILELLRL